MTQNPCATHYVHAQYISKGLYALSGGVSLASSYVLLLL